MDQFLAFEQRSTQDDGALFGGLHHHLHAENANSTQKWFFTDQPSSVNTSVPFEEISYSFNSHGYRCDELTRSDILFLGCGNSFGVGMSQAVTWCSLIAKVYRVPYINLAWPGASTSYALRTLGKTISFVKPKAVIALFPYVRGDWIMDSNTVAWKQPSSLSVADRDYTFSGGSLFNGRREEYELLSDIQALATLCQLAKSRLVWSTFSTAPQSEWFKKQRVGLGEHVDSTAFMNITDPTLKARDGLHGGQAAHATFATDVINHLDAR